MRGSMTSNSSARIRIAVAPSASGTARLAGPAGRAREEDHALGVTGDVVEAADDLGLAPAPAAVHRDRGPHAFVELAAELLDQGLLVLGDLDVPFGDQDLAMPRLHAQE